MFFLLLAGLHYRLLQVLLSWSPCRQSRLRWKRGMSWAGIPLPFLQLKWEGLKEHRAGAAAFSGWAAHRKGDPVPIKPPRTRLLHHSFWEHTLRGSLKIGVSSWWGSQHRASAWQPEQTHTMTLAGVTGSFQIHFNNRQNKKGEFFTMPFLGLLDLFAKWSNPCKDIIFQSTELLSFLTVNKQVPHRTGCTDKETPWAYSDLKYTIVCVCIHTKVHK